MDSQLFDTTFEHDYLDFTGDEGFKYGNIVEFLDLQKSDVSKIAGVSQSSVRYDKKIPKGVKERLEQIANVCLIVAEFFNGDVNKTSIWFKSPNPQLGNLSPRDMIRFNRYKKLMKYIHDARKENMGDKGKR